MTSALRSPFLVLTRQFPVTRPPDLEKTLDKMYFEISSAVNAREIAVYDTAQANTGQRWFNKGDPSNRLQAFRKVLVLDGIPIGDNTIAHGIQVDANTQVVHLYGTANDAPNNFIPLPYVDATGGTDFISLYMDATNVHIRCQSNTFALYNAIVVIEFILEG